MHFRGFGAGQLGRLVVWCWLMVVLDWRRKESLFIWLQDLFAPLLGYVELQFRLLLRVELMVLGLPSTRITPVLCLVDSSV